MELDKAASAKITSATLATEPSLTCRDNAQLLLSQGFVRGHLTPNQTIDLMTDDRRSCDGLLLLTIQAGGEADFTFIHLVQGDPYREATIQLVDEAIATHPEGTRFATLVTSHSFGSGTIWQGSDRVFKRLHTQLQTFIGNGRLDIRAIDPDIVSPTHPFELGLRISRDVDTSFYHLFITNTDYSLQFSVAESHKVASQKGTVRRIPDNWD